MAGGLCDPKALTPYQVRHLLALYDARATTKRTGKPLSALPGFSATFARHLITAGLVVRDTARDPACTWRRRPVFWLTAAGLIAIARLKRAEANAVRDSAREAA